MILVPISISVSDTVHYFLNGFIVLSHCDADNSCTAGTWGTRTNLRHYKVKNQILCKAVVNLQQQL